METRSDANKDEQRERSAAIEVAEATPDDAQAVAAVRREAWLATYPNDQLGITREQVAATDFDSAAALEAARGLASPGRPEPASMGGEEPRSGGRLLFYRTRRGCPSPWSDVRLAEVPRNGIGRRLLHAALAWLGDEKPVRLEVASYNDGAIRFYERHGFRRTGRAAT